MKPLLLLMLPALLAGCQKPQTGGEAPAAEAGTGASATDAAPPPASSPQPDAATSDAATTAAAEAAAAAAASTGSTGFAEVAVIRAAGVLPRHLWRLTGATDAAGERIGPLFARPAQPVTLTIKGGQLSTTNTCNAIAGSYRLSGHALLVDKLASTGKACADPALTALDSEIGKRLEGRLGLRMSTSTPLQLELRNVSGDVLVFAGERIAAAAPAKE